MVFVDFSELFSSVSVFQVEIADFETLERKLKCITPSKDLKPVLLIIKNGRIEV